MNKSFIVLTGAGFTKNFGGFLAKEVWSKIFNHPIIQRNPRLKSMLTEDYDFESVYARVLEGQEFSAEEKSDIQKVIQDVYFELDETIRTWVFNSDNPLALNTYGLFGSFFVKAVCIFTLNQDLLMERQLGWRCPGVPAFPQDFYNLHSRDFQEKDYVHVPTEDVKDKISLDFRNHAGLTYIKLHGSFGWRSFDGGHGMVLGKNKVRDIEREPLLAQYSDLFRKELNQDDQRLVIVGYGFGDQHINQMLVDGIQNHGLKVYLITTKDPQELRKYLENGHVYALSIFDGLRGYFPYTLREIFPPDQSESTHFKEIMRTINSD